MERSSRLDNRGGTVDASILPYGALSGTTQSAHEPLLFYTKHAKEFQDKWTQYNVLARQSSDLINTLDSIEAKKNVLENMLSEDSINLSNEKWLDVVRLIRALIEVDRKYPTRWETIRAIHRRHGHHAD